MTAMNERGYFTAGRYAIFDPPLARGGMATVHLGRLVGAGGFSRVVAIKRMRPEFAKDPSFVKMFLDEARVASRLRHPAIVPTLDAVLDGGELFLALEYVEGEALDRLLGATMVARTPLPVPVVVAILWSVLEGLHAAHEARDQRGEPLDLVHRDVSPQNVLVGIDGLARLIDFGIAKAVNALHMTNSGQLKGKPAYMSPEHILAGEVSRVGDVWGAGVMLWEMLAGERLFAGKGARDVAMRVLERPIEAPSTMWFRRWSPAERAAHPDRGAHLSALDAVVARALAVTPAQRFATAHEFARALVEAVPPAPLAAVAQLVAMTARDALVERAAFVRRVEETTIVTAQPSSSSVVRDVVAADETEPNVVARAGTHTQTAQVYRSTATSRGPEEATLASPMSPDALSPPPAAAPHGREVTLPLPDARREEPSSGGVHVATTSTSAHAAPRARWVVAAVLALGALAAVGAAGAIVLALRWSAATARATPKTSVATPSTPLAATTMSSAAPEERPTSAPSAVTAASSAGVPSLPDAGAPPNVERARTTRTAAKRPGCEPPYIIDVDGVKRWKPECF